MHNSKDLFQDFLRQISTEGNEDESRSIGFMVFENLFHLSPTDIYAGRMLAMTTAQKQQLDTIIRRINTHEPIQYILGEAEFLRRKFFVDSSVLIPRPETEELVLLVKSKLKSTTHHAPRILDIGTGSGCIPISLALEIPSSEVFAFDVSDAALQVAQKNATALGANVKFSRHDILNEDITYQNLNAVVSNPPYITMDEKAAMMQNVLAFEPHLALFVTNDDPLLFYKAIASKSAKALLRGGLLSVEINEKFAQEVAELFDNVGYTDITIFKDLSGKDRIVSGVYG